MPRSLLKRLPSLCLGACLLHTCPELMCRELQNNERDAPSGTGRDTCISGGDGVIGGPFRLKKRNRDG